MSAPFGTYEPAQGMAGAEIAKPGPRNMDTAPRDGTMLKLLVRYARTDPGDHPLEDVGQGEAAWTIGFNNLDNTGEDEWQIAGWSWQSDCFTEGHGTPIGWLPFHDDVPKQPQPMPFERADEIAQAINDRAFFAMGMAPSCRSLEGVSLRQMLDAVEILERAGSTSNGDGTRTLRVRPAERLIAAAYVLENYEPSTEAIVLKPHRSWPFDRLALGVFGLEPGQGNEGGEA